MWQTKALRQLPTLLSGLFFSSYGYTDNFLPPESLTNSDGWLIPKGLAWDRPGD
jgi:hypothetical protein